MDKGQSPGKRRYQREREIARCTQLLSEEPGNAELWYRRANAHRQKGNMLLAVCDYNRALRLRPNYPEALFYKAIACGAMGCRYEEARAYRSFLACEGGGDQGLILRIWRRMMELEERLGLPHS